MKQNKLVIITPCFNEEEIIEYSIEQLSLLLNIMIMDNLVSADSMIVFVNDGSNDKTEEIIANHCKTNKNLALINLSKNYGQQNAILAGLNLVDANMYVTIDVDLQDDHKMIIEMVKKYYEG